MRIENYRRSKVPVFAILVALYLLISAALICGTIFSFAPRCREFDRQMESMRRDVDSIKQGWEDLRP